MAKIKPTSSNKESRLSIRVDAERKAVIARAAKQHGRTISDVVLENAYRMATELLADERTIAPSKKQVARILKYSITRPPRVSRPVASYLPSGRSWMAERLPAKLVKGLEPQSVPSDRGALWWLDCVDVRLPSRGTRNATQRRPNQPAPYYARHRDPRR